MERVRWIYKEIYWFLIRVLHVICGKYLVNREKFAGVGLHSKEDANEFMYQKILEGKPFAVGRFGYTELGVMELAQIERYFKIKLYDYWTPSYVNGISYRWDGDIGKGVQKFDLLMRDSMHNLDAVGCYVNMVMSDEIIRKCANLDTKFIFDANALSLFAYMEGRPWTWALKGKKVLVVSPFYKEIESQYNRRELIWNREVLPEFELLTDQSIWFSESESENWFQAFERLADRVIKRDFDIALLGCGSFSFPLAARVKKSGRQAIHVAGVLQILFGIKGKRWDANGLYNEYWIRPGEETKPAFAEQLDGSTYW